MHWTEKDIEHVIKIRDGILHIEVAHCLHCERLAIAPIIDDCPCGAEMYPVVKLVKLGEAYLDHELRAEMGPYKK